MLKRSFGLLVVVICFIFSTLGSIQCSKEDKAAESMPVSDEAPDSHGKGSDDLLTFLEETPHLDFNNPVFTEALAKVIDEKMTTEEKLEKLYYFTRDTITFVPSASLTSSGALKEMKAICYTKAMIYVSFCRRLGVPANVALVEFIIKARPKKVTSGHGIAKVYYKGKWVYLDTVSNKEAWSYWDKENAHLLEPPVFSLDHNVLVDERFVSNLAVKDFETNDVPEKWLKSLQNFLDEGKY